MKKLFLILALTPLLAVGDGHGSKSAEHGGKAAAHKEHGGKAAEHGGKAAEHKEHGGVKAESKGN